MNEEEDEEDEDDEDQAPRTPERIDASRGASGVGSSSGQAGGQAGASSLDGIMETFVSPSHEAIRSKIENYEETTTSPAGADAGAGGNRGSSSSGIGGRGDGSRGGDAKQQEAMESSGDREEDYHPHRFGRQETKKSSSTLHRKDTQSTQKEIELKFRQFLEKVQTPLNDIAASNVLRGVPSEHLVCVLFSSGTDVTLLLSFILFYSHISLPFYMYSSPLSPTKQVLSGKESCCGWTSSKTSTRAL
jgi:hypothetical protein